MKKAVSIVGLLSILAFFSFSCRDVDTETIQKALEVHTIPGAQYVGMESCALCHEATVKQYRLESHYGTSLKEGEKIKGEACESCHGPGSLHVDNNGDKSKIIRYSPERCFACHSDVRMQFRLQYHHPVNEGQMSCTDCHSMHKGEGVAFRRVTDLERPNEKCFKCHKELKGPFVFEHDPMRDGCKVCHEPHGSVYNKLLVANKNALCIRCHWEPGTNTAAGQFGGLAHGAGAENAYIGAGEECVDHHRAPHGSNISRTFNR